MPTTLRSWRVGLVAAASAALVLASAGPASAHPTNISGTMVLTGNAGGTSTLVGNGITGYGGPESCGTPVSDAMATASSGSVALVVSPTPKSQTCAASKLSGTFHVIFINDSPAPSLRGCVHEGSVSAVEIGTMSVVAGNGSGTYSLPNGLTPTAPGGAIVCLTNRKISGGTIPSSGVGAYLTIVA